MNKLSQYDFMTIMLKMGLNDDDVLIANNLWLRVGLTHVLLGNKYYRLRELEPS